MSHMYTLQEKISEFGLGLQAVIHDSRIHRFTPDGDKSKCGWYVSYDNGDFQSGAFGCWKRDIHERFCSIDTTKLTSWQMQDYRKQCVRQKRELESIVWRRNKTAQSAIEKRWVTAKVSNVSSHPYLLKKNIDALNVRLDKQNNLLVPMYDKRHDLWNIQSIALNGFKLFTKGAKVKQCFHPIGLSNKRPSQIVICEGYATGMSIYQATNLPTVVCFGASNLCSVAAVLKRKYLHSSIIVAGDNDQFNERNIGEINTYAAAEFANGKAVFPKFKDLLTKPTDFNDLHCLEGLSEVKRQIVEVCSER